MRGARARLVAVPLLLAGFARGAAAPPPSGPAAPPPSGPTVRIGDHRSYGRVVFDFPGPVGAAMTQQGAVVELRFDTPGTPAMPRRLPRNVRAMVVADGRATLTLAPGSRAREMMLGDHVVLDALDPIRGRVAAATPPMRTAPPGMEPDTRRDAAAPAPAPQTVPAGPVAIAAAHPPGAPLPPAMRPAAPAVTPADTPAAAAVLSTVAETPPPAAIAPAAASPDATAPAAQGDPTAIVVPFDASV
ncbi:MAG TPA: hypothetical protein VHY76_15570, partial [Acetobacteraceae bacterium]|nr:hypothetical protein [Acetobacteraceae bacterium]